MTGQAVCGCRWISVFRCLFIFLCLTPACLSDRLCDTRDGRSEKLFAVFENDPNGTHIGSLDIVTTNEDDSIVAPLRVIPSAERCGPKPCDQWINFNHVTQELTLNVTEGQVLDKDGAEGVDIIEISIACSLPTASKWHDVIVHVTIMVDDVNDNTPQFVDVPYRIEINELSPVGTTVLQVNAVDKDQTAHLFYSVIEGQVWSSYFSIPRSMDGKVVQTKMLDYESLKQNNTIFLDVEVVNRGRHGDREIIRRNNTTVKIRVLDGDDHPPRFDLCEFESGECFDPTYNAFLQEGIFSFDAIQLHPAMLHATDPDEGIRQTILYQLVDVMPPSFNQYFSVAPDSGEVRQELPLPPKDVAAEYTLYVKAFQTDNHDMYSIATVHIKVVISMKDDFPPVILNGDSVEGFVDLVGVDRATFVRSSDSSILRLEARDDDYPRDLQPGFSISFVDKDAPFEITNEGLVVASLDRIAKTGQHRFELQVKVENPDATVEKNRFGKFVTLTIKTKPIPKVSELSKLARNDNCTTSGGEMNGTFVAAFGAFCGLFIVCIPILIYLVIQLRRYKAAARHGSQPYSMNQSFGQKYDGFSFANQGFRSDADSFTSSGRTAVSKRVLSESIERIGHMIKAPTVDDDVPHIAPLEAMKRVKKQKKIEDVASIVPFRTHTPIHAQKWKDDVMEHCLSFDQIRVENWLTEEKTKKCGVGEVNLGSPRPCFVKILTGQFPDKVAASDDVSAMNQVLLYSACTHPNVVKFYGSCVQDDSLYIVNEFVSSRDLRNVLVSSRMLDHSAVISSLSGAQLLNFVIGIAEGLFYLHDNGVLHAALCASNVRVNDSLTAKLAECCGETSQRFKLKSKRWLAPEVAEEQPYTEKSDVWSFGVLVWEILSLGGTPFDDQADILVPEYVRRQLSTGGSILPVTRNTTKRFWMLLQRCWAGDPLDRPNINDVKNLLCKMKANSNAITVAKAPGYRFFPASTVH